MFDSDITRNEAMAARMELPEERLALKPMTLEGIKALADEMGMSFKAALNEIWQAEWKA